MCDQAAPICQDLDSKKFNWVVVGDITRSREILNNRREESTWFASRSSWKGKSESVFIHPDENTFCAKISLVCLFFSVIFIHICFLLLFFLNLSVYAIFAS